ncbi:MAG: UDP-N-acetylmuramate--L-alanine ligase [Candidatus Parcubacteria bacterium]|nr:MAG: UDP-N-acetylmuramate--L-alanine ligase [Candidatus Parcubacteria bacterium]
MKIHFIGIGGIGISALAKYYLYQGNEISGSDLSYPLDVFSKEEFEKIKFFLGHNEKNINQNIDLIIYSLAVKKNNPEILKGKKINIPILSYPQALGKLTQNYFTIAVSGMHGKSTTTAMVAQILIEARFDPVVIIGSKVKNFGFNGGESNFRYGKSNYLIIEADEYKAGFLNYHPNILVITNIEAEHLDYYKNLNNIIKTFSKLILNLKGDKKYLIINRDDQGLKTFIKKNENLIKKNKIILKPYGLKDNQKEKIKLNIPGKHNISNALASLRVAEILNIKKNVALKALKKFKGIWRRFEYKGKINGAKIFDDYGHHPTEIKSTLQAAYEILPIGGRLFIVFQPHQYYRTFYHFSEFIHAFDLADYVVILDIYTVAGRESKKIMKLVNSQKLVTEIKKHKKNVIYLPSFDSVIYFLKKKLKEKDICLIMGAGDIYKLTEKLFKYRI